MVVSFVRLRTPSQALAGVALFACGALLSGCAGMSDGMTSAFADPAKYQLYDCKQLETERKSLATRMAELQGLMNKAQDGFGGPVVAEVAYRNDYIALRGQSKYAEDAWRENKCRDAPPSSAKAEASAPMPAAPAAPPPRR
jgi:hypothetical protein